MHEKIEMKSHNGAVMLSTAWPMLIGFTAMCAVMLLLYPPALALPIIGLMLAIMAVTFAACVRMYMGTYLFLPATEYKGARIIARLGRGHETEISGVLAGDIIVKQGWSEKLLHVCHIRQKGTVVYLRGVRDMEKVQAWVAANFPASRPEAAPRKAKKNGKK